MTAQSYRLEVVTTTDGRLERDVVVDVLKSERLGCGCRRLHATRPGPSAGQLGTNMHLIVDRCPWHQANSPDGTPEPKPVQT